MRLYMKQWTTATYMRRPNRDRQNWKKISFEQIYIKLLKLEESIIDSLLLLFVKYFISVKLTEK
jgi:hypothetical protein